MSRVLRINEVCNKLGVSRSTLYLWIDQGILPAPFKINPHGRAVGYLESQIDAYLTKIST